MNMTAYSSAMSYSYDKKNLVLKDVSLDIPFGKCIGLVGPNGAGKTTFIRCLLGVFSPSAGTVNIFGYNPQKERENIINEIGYLPEGAGVYPNLTLKQYLKLFASLRGVDDVFSRQSKLLEILDLGDVLGKKLSTFSKGMKQKAKLAAVFIHSPRFLILDEPTEGLDMAAKEEIIAYINKLKSEGVSMLLATHDPYVIECLCDKIAVLLAGGLVYKGTINKFKESIEAEPYFEIRLKEILKNEEIKDLSVKNPGINCHVAEETVIELPGYDEEKALEFNKELVMEGFRVKSFNRMWPSFSKAYRQFLERPALHKTNN